MVLLGVDVSHYQGVIDWTKTGVDFAFAKATEGNGFRDGAFAANVHGLRTAGKVPGAYHFLTAGGAAAQADWFCSVAPADCIHALDVEGSGLDVAGWVKQYRFHYPTKTLLIYTGRDLWTRAGGGHGASFGPLWAAGYIPNAYLAAGSLATVASRIGSNRGGVPFAGWTAPLFLQFTDKAQVPGISGSVDGDVFYGTRAELVALTTMDSGVDMPLVKSDLDAIKALLDTEGDIVLSTQSRVNAANLNGGTYKLGDVIPAANVNIWGNLRAGQLLAITSAIKSATDQLIAGQAALAAALTAAVAAGGVLTPVELQAAAEAGATAALDRLSAALDVPVPPA
jgi:lysozyme